MAIHLPVLLCALTILGVGLCFHHGTVEGVTIGQIYLFPINGNASDAEASSLSLKKGTVLGYSIVSDHGQDLNHLPESELSCGCVFKDETSSYEDSEAQDHIVEKCVERTENTLSFLMDLDDVSDSFQFECCLDVKEGPKSCARAGPTYSQSPSIIWPDYIYPTSRNIIEADCLGSCDIYHFSDCRDLDGSDHYIRIEISSFLNGSFVFQSSGDEEDWDGRFKCKWRAYRYFSGSMTEAVPEDSFVPVWDIEEIATKIMKIENSTSVQTMSVVFNDDDDDPIDVGELVTVEYDGILGYSFTKPLVRQTGSKWKYTVELDGIVNDNVELKFAFNGANTVTKTIPPIQGSLDTVVEECSHIDSNYALVKIRVNEDDKTNVYCSAPIGVKFGEYDDWTYLTYDDDCRSSGRVPRNGHGCGDGLFTSCYGVVRQPSFSFFDIKIFAISISAVIVVVLVVIVVMICVLKKRKKAKKEQQNTLVHPNNVSAELAEENTVERQFTDAYRLTENEEYPPIQNGGLMYGVSSPNTELVNPYEDGELKYPTFEGVYNLESDQHRPVFRKS